MDADVGTAWSMPSMVHKGASPVKSWGRRQENSAGSPPNAWLCPCEKDPVSTPKQNKRNEKHGECEYRPPSWLLGITAAIISMVINLSTATRTVKNFVKAGTKLRCWAEVGNVAATGYQEHGVG